MFHLPPISPLPKKANKYSVLTSRTITILNDFIFYICDCSDKNNTTTINYNYKFWNGCSFVCNNCKQVYVKDKLNPDYEKYKSNECFNHHDFALYISRLMLFSDAEQLIKDYLKYKNVENVEQMPERELRKYYINIKMNKANLEKYKPCKIILFNC